MFLKYRKCSRYNIIFQQFAIHLIYNEMSDIKENNDTKHIPCYLADWGYLKNTDRNNLPYEIKLLKTITTKTVKNLKRTYYLYVGEIR